MGHLIRSLVEIHNRLPQLPRDSADNLRSDGPEQHREENGERRNPVFTMIRSQELVSINCAVEKIAKPEEPRIRDILFEDAEALTT